MNKNNRSGAGKMPPAPKAQFAGGLHPLNSSVPQGGFAPERGGNLRDHNGCQANRAAIMATEHYDGDYGVSTTTAPQRAAAVAPTNMGRSGSGSSGDVVASSAGSGSSGATRNAVSGSDSASSSGGGSGSQTASSATGGRGSMTATSPTNRGGGSGSQTASAMPRHLKSLGGSRKR